MLGLSPRGAGAQRLRAGFQRQRVSDEERDRRPARQRAGLLDRKSTRLNSSHLVISYAVFCLKKKQTPSHTNPSPEPTPPATAPSSYPPTASASHLIQTRPTHASSDPSSHHAYAHPSAAIASQ